jgi:hypothetical protein
MMYLAEMVETVELNLVAVPLVEPVLLERLVILQFILEVHQLGR